jgi:Cupin
MKSPDPNASNASDQQGQPTRFSRRQLLAGTPLAALGVVLEGHVRTTVISPDGQAETDEFQVGDIWYFPKGHGHALECLGNQPCHFLLGFDSGHFSEFGTFSVTDWLGHTDLGILSRALNLPAAAFASTLTAARMDIEPVGFEKCIGIRMQMNGNS